MASGLDQHLQQQTAEEYVRQTGTLSGFQHAATNDRLHSSLAVRSPAGKCRTGAVHNDFRNGNVMVDAQA